MAGADVVVDAGGAFRVVADATDVPGGDGHAFLARSISTRVLPRARPSLGLRDHRAYTRALRSVLARAAPAGQASPRIVVVTGPPDEPGFVENAYLATQLGYNLAESGDVVVRGGRAWLRSLEGLEQIDVLLRRVPETELDPVEDDRVAGAGVAGVVEAVRDHGVAVVNPHGAGVAASPALQPFLDDAARFLTGRPLRLPSVPSVWCGDPEARAAVLAAPDRWILHDADPRAAEPPAVGAELADAEVAAWAARITATPRALRGPGGDPPGRRAPPRPRRRRRPAVGPGVAAHPGPADRRRRARGPARRARPAGREGRADRVPAGRDRQGRVGARPRAPRPGGRGAAHAPGRPAAVAADPGRRGHVLDRAARPSGPRWRPAPCSCA